MKKLIVIILLCVPSTFVYSQVADHIVIAEIYAGGGVSGSTWTHDYIVLYNPTESSVDVSTWSVQVACPSCTTWVKNNLIGSIASDSYYAIRGAGGSMGNPLPFTPSVIGSVNLNILGYKVALVSNQTNLTGFNPLDSAFSVNIVDFIGYGLGSVHEGSGQAPELSDTSSARRKDNSGFNTYGTNGSGWDTDDNAADYYEEPDLINNQPLPVELSSFSAIIVDEDIKLNWRTETEVSNYGFEILRQAQDDNWKVLGFVEGHGNSNSPNEYSFIDENVTSGIYSYRLKQVDNDGKFEYSKIIEVNLDVPFKFELSQNYPNPFNPNTIIKFNLPNSGKVKLTVFDLLGQEVETLVNEEKEAGIHTIKFNASQQNSGLYFYKLETPSYLDVKKMMLIK